MARLRRSALSILKVYGYMWRSPRLLGSPQRKGVALRLRICTPRKPNSARRPIIKLKLSTRRLALAHIPGTGHNLRRYSRTLISGVGARDLPMVNYSCIRGVYDFEGLLTKNRRRSVYGAPMPAELKTHIRRCFRQFTD